MNELERLRERLREKLAKAKKESHKAYLKARRHLITKPVNIPKPHKNRNSDQMKKDYDAREKARSKVRKYKELIKSVEKRIELTRKHKRKS